MFNRRKANDSKYLLSSLSRGKPVLQEKNREAEVPPGVSFPTDSSLTYLKDTFTFALYAATFPSSSFKSRSDTSAMRRSFSDLPAMSTAFFAASSHDLSLDPTSSMIL